MIFLNNNGCIHLYHGDGKGKTTCAMGLALRYAYYGHEVLIIQCLKNGSSGEIHQLNRFQNITILADKVSTNFSWNMTQQEKYETRVLHDNYLQHALSQEWDMLVLDEICAALNQDLVSEELVVALLEQKKAHQEIVMTGRNPTELLLRNADYITRMSFEKHPFSNGLQAREGIEF